MKNTLKELQINQLLNFKYSLQTARLPHKSKGAGIHFLHSLQQTIQGAALALFVRRFGAFATVVAVA